MSKTQRTYIISGGVSLPPPQNREEVEKLKPFIQKEQMAVVNISGKKEGSEKSLLPLFRGGEFKNEYLYDIVTNGIQVELKVQENSQWFDLRKYGGLTAEQEKIVIVFAIHTGKGGKYSLIGLYGICLGDFIRLMKATAPVIDGWNDEVIGTGTSWRSRFSQVILKAPVSVRPLIKNNSSHFVNLLE